MFIAPEGIECTRENFDKTRLPVKANTVPQDRAWALGMTEEQFEVEFKRRYYQPYVDTIPSLDDYLHPIVFVSAAKIKEYKKQNKPEPTSSSIKTAVETSIESTINLDAMSEVELKALLAKVKAKVKPEKTYSCIHCGRVCKSALGKSSHERRCSYKDASEKPV